MPIRNLHHKPFDEGTQDKLDLYREYLREWLPVFIHSLSINSINVFDFFAGPGFDVDGKPGSPVITCEEIKNALIKNDKKGATIKVYFNEKDLDKYNSLLSYIEEQRFALPQVSFSNLQKDFHLAFVDWSPDMHGGVANLLFLDQNGVKEISKSVFQSILKLPRTDFLFFISSAMVNRFKNQPEIKERVPVTEDDYSRMNGTNVHRIVADAYRRWIPAGFEYYLGSFSIKKGANVYGLVFGSGHPLGIDKFLNVAWKHGGDANFDIDNDKIDPSQPSLFPEMDKPSKISAFEKELASAVMGGHLKTNKEVYIYSLQSGMLASHARNAFDLLIKNNKIPKQTLHISYDAWKKQDTERISLS